jgi:hypothetical protein
MIPQREHAEILLGEAIARDLVPARGRQIPYGPEQDVPSGDFSPERVERRSLTRPKMVLDVFGGLAILPRHLLPNYKGHHWCSIKVDSAAVKRAFPRSLIELEPASPGAETEPAIADPTPAASAAPTMKETRQAASASRRGRPSPKGTVRTEAQRQLDKEPGSIRGSLKKWGDILATWLATQPDETPVNGRTIEGYIRDLYRSAKRKVIKSVN